MNSRIQFGKRKTLFELPTPVEELPQLSALLKGPTLLTKRDDLTGLAFGGNKIRKLEYLLWAAQEAGANTLITAGAVQSNHCRQTAAVAARFGFDCILVEFGDPPSPPDGNHLLHHLLGAEVIYTARHDMAEKLNQVYQAVLASGRQPYLIPYGGSNPIGVLGYVNAMQELAQQAVKPDWIVFPTSSGGTQAGMLLGARLTGFDGKILGISVDEPADELQATIADLAAQTAQTLNLSETFSLQDILVSDAYIGDGYAVMGSAEVEAIRLFAAYEGLMVDPVYTGRAAAGLIDLIRSGFFKPDETVLFWHTGGTPALFASRYQGTLLA